MQIGVIGQPVEVDGVAMVVFEDGAQRIVRNSRARCPVVGVAEGVGFGLQVGEVVVVQLLVRAQRSKQEVLDLHVVGAPDL